MDFERIFYLSPSGIPGALEVASASDETSTGFKSNQKMKSALIRGEVIPPLPLNFVWSSGETAMDHITTTLVTIHLFSQRVFECFRRHRFTGWSSFPIRLAGRDGKDLRDYGGLAVTGRCGRIDNARSVRTVRPARKIEGDADVMMGLYFDPGSWDGTHIFTPGGKVFVLQDVKSALEEIGATNFCFMPLTRVENQMATLELRHPMP